jgi:basic amino acid/polyamine antiporter, APA family
VVIVTVVYIALGIVLTGLVSYTTLDVPDPISKALHAAPLAWLDSAVDVAAVLGLFATVVVTRMSGDGLLPSPFARIDPRRRTPVANTLIRGATCATVSAFAPIAVLGDLVSIGALALMTTLPASAWLRLVVWLLIGLAVFFGTGLSRRRPHRRADYRGDGETRTRTGDTTIFSRVLYQLSYLAVAAQEPSALRATL